MYRAIAYALLMKEVWSQSFPVSLTNCGYESTYASSPKRAVTMNQAATEIMLSLHLEDSMVGTAYLDDEILPALKDTYETIPVLSATYPSYQELLDVNPDFIYASYSSAFRDAYAGPRDNLTAIGVESYVSPSACEDRSLRPNPVYIEDVFGEIHDIGTIFGIAQSAEALTTELQADLDQVANTFRNVDLSDIKVFWFDSFNDNGVYAGACCGAPGMIMNLLGVKNVFGDKEGSWATVSWEEVLASDPDVIVIVDASWDTELEKIEKLKEPAFADMKAVMDESWVSIDFSYTTPNIRNVEAVQIIGAYIHSSGLDGSTQGSSKSKKSSNEKDIILIVVIIAFAIFVSSLTLLLYMFTCRAKKGMPSNSKEAGYDDIKSIAVPVEKDPNSKKDFDEESKEIVSSKI